MAIPVARVHLKVAHAALPALLPTPPRWKKMLPPLLPTPCLAAVLPVKPLAKPSRADSDERWDVHKIKSSSSTSSPRPADSVKNGAERGSSRRKNVTSPASPLPKPGRADAAERWDAHKKPASPASLSSSSGASFLASSSKWPISRASLYTERWDVHKKRRPQQAELLDDGESSATGSDDMDTDTEEEILWKPRVMYAGPGFVAAVPEPNVLPMPTAFLVRVA